MTKKKKKHHCHSQTTIMAALLVTYEGYWAPLLCLAEGRTLSRRERINGRNRSTNEHRSERAMWTPLGLIIKARACVFVFMIRTCQDERPCIVHTASACTVLHYRTPADGWLVLIHSRGTDLSRQLDSLTDLTADNPAGSVSCNNPGRGVILFGSCQHETQCFPALYSSAEPKSW